MNLRTKIALVGTNPCRFTVICAHATVQVQIRNADISASL